MGEQSLEVVKWYTRARRFPQLIGKTPDGARIWGGPYTYTQLVGAVTVLVVGAKTVGVWGQFGLVGNALILVAVAYATTLMLGRLPVGSRNPLAVGAGLLHALSRPAAGRFAGAPVRIRRPHRARTRVVLNPPPPADPDPGPVAAPPRADRQRRALVPAASPQPNGATGPRTAGPAVALTGVQRLLASASTRQDRLMRTPTRAMAANLRWTRTGTVWADWILTGQPYGLRPVKDKHNVRTLHQALFRALPGESLLLGLCAGLDPAAVVEKMLHGVDLSACPHWVAECEATLDTLEAIGPGQRIYWLSVPLGIDKPSDRALEPLHAAMADLRDAAGLPRDPIPAADVQRRLAQAARIAEAIPAPFNPTPATAAQMVWLHQHSIRRGLFLDLDLPSPAPTDVVAQLLTAKGSSALTEPWLDEGGQSDLTGNTFARLNPLSRRFLKVADAAAVTPDPASYQALLVVSDVPDGGMIFPGSELIGRIDESGLAVDWAMRLSVRPSAAVAAQNQRALRNLNEQYGQRSGELSHGVNMLDRVAQDLAEYVAVLDSDKLEVETQATIIFCVAGPDADAARTQARALSDYLADTGYKLAQPVGYQEQLWWAMQPGVRASRAVREFAQITTSKALAATVPLASVTLGDQKGSLLGLNIAHGPLLAPDVTCGPTGVILHDLDGASDRQISGSMAVAGELGAGKALALDTPIPTPTGWALMGDLTVGDHVFDDQGQPTLVLGTSPVMTGRRCYEVVFSDGSTITADADHLWSTVPDRARSQPAKNNDQLRIRGVPGGLCLASNTEKLAGPGWHNHAQTVTTAVLKDTLQTRGQANHAIPTAGALRLPAADLPVAPYVLGCWLGDRCSAGAQFFTADRELLARIEAAGYPVTKLKDDHSYAVTIRSELPPKKVTVGCACCGATTPSTHAVVASAVPGARLRVVPWWRIIRCSAGAVAAESRLLSGVRAVDADAV